MSDCIALAMAAGIHEEEELRDRVLMRDCIALAMAAGGNAEWLVETAHDLRAVIYTRRARWPDHIEGAVRRLRETV